jgi:hypothetical protein
VVAAVAGRRAGRDQGVRESSVGRMKARCQFSVVSCLRLIAPARPHRQLTTDNR